MVTRAVGADQRPPPKQSGLRTVIIGHGAALIAQSLAVALEESVVHVRAVCDGDELDLAHVDALVVCDTPQAHRVAGTIDALRTARRRIQVVAVGTPRGFRADVRLPATATVRDLARVLHGDADVVERLDEIVPRQESERRPGALGRLTRRETEVVTLLMAGVTNIEIAAQLGLSPNTVRTHVQNVMTKLGVSSRLEVAGLAAAHAHLLPPSDTVHTWSAPDATR